jgi:hypothetical protein
MLNDAALSIRILVRVGVEANPHRTTRRIPHGGGATFAGAGVGWRVTVAGRWRGQAGTNALGWALAPAEQQQDRAGLAWRIEQGIGLDWMNH